MHFAAVIFIQLRKFHEVPTGYTISLLPYNESLISLKIRFMQGTHRIHHIINPSYH